MINIKQMSNEELEKVKGGSITVWTGLLIISAVIFISGVIDGIVNPTECKNEDN